MSKEMKYVIINEMSPILFGLEMKHSDFEHMKVTSAGKCRIYFETDRFIVDCFGDSISLNLTSDEKDKGRIERLLNHY